MTKKIVRRSIRMTDEQLKLIVSLVGNHTYGAHKEIFQLYEKMLNEQRRRELGNYTQYRFVTNGKADYHIIDTRDPNEA